MFNEEKKDFYERLYEVCEKMERCLGDNHIYAECVPYGREMPVVDVNIRWGDWKHDHLRAKWLLGEAGYHLISSEVTEENGSDCYSAVHHFYVEGMQ